MTKIRFQLVPKPTEAEKAAQGKTGFVPVAGYLREEVTLLTRLQNRA